MVRVTDEDRKEKGQVIRLKEKGTTFNVISHVIYNIIYIASKVYIL